jgi:putative transposon-encoded protein
MRQGCPLSPTLFVVVIEMLNIYIKSKQKLEGVLIGGEQHIISQFADDTSFFISNKTGMIDRLFTHLQTFGRMSGLKLNVDKTEIVLLGNTNKLDIPKNYWHLIKDSAKSLGINIFQDLNETTKQNYETALNKMTESMKFWSKKPLSLTGKINMIKCQLTSKLTYCMNVLPDPGKEFWKRANKHLYSFISNNKPEKLKRSTLINRIELGGAQMVDLECQGKALKAMWLIRAAYKPGPWSFSLKEILGHYRIDDFLQCNLKETDIPFKIEKNSIWYDIVHNWCEVNYRDKVIEPDDITAESLWFNSHLKIDNKVLWNRHWWDKGIHLICDLMDVEKGDFLTDKELTTKYELRTNFLEIGAMRQAIPGKWKKALLAHTQPPDITNASQPLVEKCIQSKRGSHLLYNKLLAGKATSPTDKLEKWKEELDLDIETDTILKSMVKGRRALKYSKLQSFSYNMLQRNLIYGHRLLKMKEAEDDKCMECGQTETIRHLYWDCRVKRNLWITTNNILKNTTPEDLNPGFCLLNIMTTPKKQQEKNLIATLNTTCAHYIHRKRCRGERTSSNELVNIFRQIKAIELLVATDHSKIAQHIEKWAQVDL